VGPVLIKVFAMILEARLSSWAERGAYVPGDRLVLGKIFAPRITYTFCERSLNRAFTNAKRCTVVLWISAKLLI
jgi:hypothetical protein